MPSLTKKRLTQDQKYYLILFIVLAALIAFATSCMNQSPEQKAERIVAKISRDLDLSEIQKAKLDELKQAILHVRYTNQADRMKQSDEIKVMILSDRLDAEKLKELIAEREKMFDQNFDQVFASAQAFHTSLSPEQRRKAAACFDKFSKRMQGIN